MKPPINDWGVPIVRFETRSLPGEAESGGAVLYRVVAPVSGTPLREPPMVADLHGLRTWRPMATALFLLMEDGYPALSFRLDILTVVSATHVRSIQSPFMRNPFQGPELYGQILWTLTELLGIDVFDPRELSPTPQSELFLPIRAGAKQMTQAVDANNWIAQLQIDEPDYLKAPEDIEEALATDSSAPSRFFASL